MGELWMDGSTPWLSFGVHHCPSVAVMWRFPLRLLCLVLITLATQLHNEASSEGLIHAAPSRSGPYRSIGLSYPFLLWNVMPFMVVEGLIMPLQHSDVPEGICWNLSTTATKARYEMENVILFVCFAWSTEDGGAGCCFRRTEAFFFYSGAYYFVNTVIKSIWIFFLPLYVWGCSAPKIQTLAYVCH